MKRRDFITKTALSVPMLSLFPADLSSIHREILENKIEKRLLGKTGMNISMIGFGGIVVKDASSDEAASRVKEAIDFGVNYFDVAPSYGNAEEMLGPALEPYRKNVYLACKTQKRDKDGAKKELEESLLKLKTDYFDVYQLHAVTTLEDVETIFSKQGAMKTILKAKDQGIIKHIGFSAHSVEAATELMNRFDFDTILFPFNYACWYQSDFGPQIMEIAKEKEMGILALKAMAHQRWQAGTERSNNKTWYEPHENEKDAELGLRFTLSHPVAAAIPPGHEDLFSMALRLALRFRPLEDNEIKDMKERAMNADPLFKYPMV